MGRDVDIGFIGLGIKGHNFADELLDMGHRILGVDADAQRRREFADRYDADVFETPDAMLDQVDACVLSCPTKFHEKMATAALEVDVPVLGLVPLAHTVESAERIVAAAGASDAFYMTGSHHRFDPYTRVLDSRVADGFFGDLTHVEARYVRRRGIPGFGTWFTSRDVAGGGALIDVGVHCLDVIMSLYDFAPVTEVSAVTRTEFGAQSDYTQVGQLGDDSELQVFDVEDSATALIRFEGGRTAVVEAAWAANCDWEHSYLVRGDRGGARLEQAGVNPSAESSLVLYESRDAGVPHHVDVAVEGEGPSGHRRQLQVFVDCVEEGECPDENALERALNLQRTLAAAYRSSEAGRAVRLDS